MILAKLFTKIFKEGGIILIDSENQKYICGSPRQINPITLKLLKKDLNWKILLNPELEFPEGFMRGDIVIENASFCLLYTSPSPRDLWISRMPSSA